MLRWPDREQSHRFNADMLALFRWPSTVAAFFMLFILTIGFIQGEEKLWPPSSFAWGAAYFCDSAVLSWIARFDQRTRQKGSEINEEEQKRYRFWKWKGTPRWLFTLGVMLNVVILAPMLILPKYRIYAIAFMGFMALVIGYDYGTWRRRSLWRG